jgi:ferredoxin-NADP reductase
MTFTLIDKKQETNDVTTFIFKSDEPLSWTPGQLLHYTLPHEDPDDRGIERWFTISSAPSEKNPALTTRFAGEKSSSFKKALFALPIGGTITADGLEGDFTLPDPGVPVVFIAGGIGITPFHSILKELDHMGTSINGTLIYANRNDAITFKSELDALAAKYPTLKIRHVIEPERIDETVIRSAVPDLSTPVFYVSGPEPMVEHFIPLFEGMGIAPEHIKHDFFPGYDTSETK